MQWVVLYVTLHKHIILGIFGAYLHSITLLLIHARQGPDPAHSTADKQSEQFLFSSLHDAQADLIVHLPDDRRLLYPIHSDPEHGHPSRPPKLVLLKLA